MKTMITVFFYLIKKNKGRLTNNELFEEMKLALGLSVTNWATQSSFYEKKLGKGPKHI